VKSPSTISLDDVGLAFVVANHYRLASELWSSCLWGEMQLVPYQIRVDSFLLGSVPGSSKERIDGR
jgi:hypothetical protein